MNEIERRVLWKDEGANESGERIGPVRVAVVQGVHRAAALLGCPYQKQCVCGDTTARQLRATSKNEWGNPLCPDCGDELPAPWVTRSLAIAMAKESGFQFEEV
jgi:hypothetical protein